MGNGLDGQIRNSPGCAVNAHTAHAIATARNGALISDAHESAGPQHDGHPPYMETDCCLVRQTTISPAGNRARRRARHVPATCGVLESAWSPDSLSAVPHAHRSYRKTKCCLLQTTFERRCQPRAKASQSLGWSPEVRVESRRQRVAPWRPPASKSWSAKSFIFGRNVPSD